MKLSYLFCIVALCAAASANAGQFKCAEKADAALAQNRLQYAVFLNALERVTDPVVVGSYDYAEKVKVSILSRDPEVQGARFSLDRPSFVALARSEDVMYQINARRTRGFEMGIYMDELDQTWVKLKGVRGSIRMNCEYKE